MKIEVYSPTIRRKEMDAVLTALVEDKIGPGDQTKLLVQIAKEKIGFDFCIALRSPAIALYLALQSLGLEEGQAVVISALSPRYFQSVLDDLKLKAVYADVAVGSPCMNRETIEKALQSKPEDITVRAVVIQHALGYPVNINPISELGFPIIEDCSQSYGSVIGNTDEANTENSGSSVNTCVFSILGLEEKDMLTAGGGALLYTASRRDSTTLRNALNSRPAGELPPEYGLPDMNAAMAVVQFREAAKNMERRKEIAVIYSQAASRTRHKCFFHDAEKDVYNNYAFPLILETGMKDVKAYARRKEIFVESAFEKTLSGSGIVLLEQCPEAYSLSLRTILFPLYPRLRAEEIERVSKLIVTLP